MAHPLAPANISVATNNSAPPYFSNSRREESFYELPEPQEPFKFQTAQEAFKEDGARFRTNEDGTIREETKAEMITRKFTELLDWFNQKTQFPGAYAEEATKKPQKKSAKKKVQDEKMSQEISTKIDSLFDKLLIRVFNIDVKYNQKEYGDLIVKIFKDNCKELAIENDYVMRALEYVDHIVFTTDTKSDAEAFYNIRKNALIVKYNPNSVGSETTFLNIKGVIAHEFHHICSFKERKQASQKYVKDCYKKLENLETQSIKCLYSSQECPDYVKDLAADFGKYYYRKKVHKGLNYKPDQSVGNEAIGFRENKEGEDDGILTRNYAGIIDLNKKKVTRTPKEGDEEIFQMMESIEDNTEKYQNDVSDGRAEKEGESYLRTIFPNSNSLEKACGPIDEEPFSKELNDEIDNSPKAEPKKPAAASFNGESQYDDRKKEWRGEL
jgi:predicted RNA-binding protein Jag